MNQENINHGSCFETRAKFLVYSENLLPSEVSKLLDLSPDEERAKGQVVANSFGKIHIQTNHFWMLSSEKHVDSLNLSDHLDYVLNKIIVSQSQILALQKIDGISMMINCVWYSKGDTSGISLTPEQMHKMSDLNILCSFYLQFYDE